MKVMIEGVVVKSILPEGKKMYKTAIDQGATDMQFPLVSTSRGYKVGEKLKVHARVSVSMFKERAYMVVVEDTIEEEQKGQETVKK